MTFNLDSLKQELLDYIASEGFAVFRGQPGLQEGLPTILWDTETHPAYQELITLGPAVLPFLFRDLEQSRDGHLSKALAAITGAHPVPADERGQVRKIAETWLRWARHRISHSRSSSATSAPPVEYAPTSTPGCCARTAPPSEGSTPPGTPRPR